MEKVVLTPATEVNFHGFQNPLEVCNAQGKPVGIFLPWDAYKKLLANLAIPYSREELERRCQEQGGSSLQDFWQRIDQS